ncbi:DUF4129 domain-containing protein [Luteimonas sp. FCS-9]|uniref:DUF4129 domain-containing protein n=1 Tax=Luteimonas sp. FCS-9 TaxID=1547516 RepID=UPI00063E9A7D|nr:DUF4129 domain-containing protein [Luteimonas sp. FCS-9]KLI99003.1 hypothetical protein WQ56_13620 [Luteimonas sp. FCS-9]
MRVETVQVELRPRTAWEAMELGNALVRRHAAAIWGPWLLCALPLFLAVNAAAWALDRLWLATLALWWLAPLLDRIPLFVLSRAVFGAAPRLRQTIAAQLRWGWRPLLGYLTWRRFSPWRAVSLPVALLEGLRGPALAQRRALLVDGVGGHALLLAVIGQAFVGLLLLSLASLVLMFVPAELLSESARAMWALVTEQPPRWVQLLGNLALWLAIGLVAPFQVGAGFGLYLNRRTQLEAWDLEIAFRRLRARIAPAAPTFAVALLAGLLLAAGPSHAQDAPADDPLAPTKTWTHEDQARERDAPSAASLHDVFDDQLADDAGFGDAVERAYADPLLDNRRIERRWQPKDRDDTPERDGGNGLNPGLFAGIAQLFALIAEYGLWILLGLLVLALALTARRWWPWMRDGLAVPAEDSEIVVDAAPPLPEALPDDLVATARGLWSSGQRRRALALLYRGSVEAMAERAGVALVPGATEAQCLRVSRRMPDADDRDAFAAMVRVWQRAAYGGRLPDDGGFEALVAALAPRFGWQA